MRTVKILCLGIWLLYGGASRATVTEAEEVILLLDRSNWSSLSALGAQMASQWGPTPRVLFYPVDQEVGDPRNRTDQQMVTAPTLLTDWERALKFLSERPVSKGQLVKILLISNGTNRIWDQSLKLSASVLADHRYGDLNEQYALLSKSGMRARQIFYQLSRRYRERNQQLLLQTSERLKRRFGHKIMVIDTSAQSAFLSMLAQNLGASYFPVSSSLEQSWPSILKSIPTSPPASRSKKVYVISAKIKSVAPQASSYWRAIVVAAAILLPLLLVVIIRWGLKNMVQRGVQKEMARLMKRFHEEQNCQWNSRLEVLQMEMKKQNQPPYESPVSTMVDSKSVEKEIQETTLQELQALMGPPPLLPTESASSRGPGPVSGTFEENRTRTLREMDAFLKTLQ